MAHAFDTIDGLRREIAGRRIGFVALSDGDKEKYILADGMLALARDLLMQRHDGLVERHIAEARRLMAEVAKKA